MKSKDGFVQAYNAQAAVDAHAQIIVAQDVTRSAVDCSQLMPMIDAVEPIWEGRPSNCQQTLATARSRTWRAGKPAYPMVAAHRTLLPPKVRLQTKPARSRQPHRSPPDIF
jgi:hypothetical protein